MNLANYLDATKLNNCLTEQEIVSFCKEAIKYKYRCICINPYFVKVAKECLKNKNIKICTVVGFPLGMNTLKIKKIETKNAINNGADEIDMVINLSNLKSFKKTECINEINAIKKICKKRILKVIFETSQLSKKEKEFALEIFNESNADFIKTSTGFIGSGANLNDVKKWKNGIKKNKFIKASGGISNKKKCLEFIKAGADCIGTSKAKEIIEGK